MHNTQGAGFVRREGGAKRVLMLRLDETLGGKESKTQHGRDLQWNCCIEQ